MEQSNLYEIEVIEPKCTSPIFVEVTVKIDLPPETRNRVSDGTLQTQLYKCAIDTIRQLNLQL